MLAARPGGPGRGAPPHHQRAAPLDEVDHRLGRLPGLGLGRDPTKRIICVSYAEDLARKLSVDTRTVLDSPWYQELFPQMRLASKRPRNTELITTQQGYRFAAGMGGSVLGRGADLIIVDDPIKATDALSEAERRRVNEAFDNTLYTRLNDKRTGAIVIIMQRLHQDDLVGHVLAKDDWEVVSIPAIETEERAYQLSDDPEDVYIRRPARCCMKPGSRARSWSRSAARRDR